MRYPAACSVALGRPSQRMCMPPSAAACPVGWGAAALVCLGAELTGGCDAPGSCTHGWRAWACRAIASTGTTGTTTFIGTTGTRAAAYARAATRRRMHPRRPPLVGPCVVFGSGAVCDCGRSAQTWMACLCCSVACVAACAGSTRPGCFEREGSAGLRPPLAGTVHQSDAVHVLRTLEWYEMV